MAQWLKDLLTGVRTKVSDAQTLYAMPGGYENLLAIPETGHPQSKLTGETKHIGVTLPQ